MKTLIVLNQTDAEPPIEEFDFVIGVDGGCKWCIENNINIHLAIGDFDSLEQHHIEQLHQHANTIDRHPSNKDLTDFELAITSALTQSTKGLTVLGVWGGRIDHSLANLLCLAKQSSDLPVTMPGGQQNGYLLKSDQKMILQGPNQQTVSIMAIVEDCHGVSNSGLKYPLDNATIIPGSGYGISNEIIASPSEISLQQGVLLILTDPDCRIQFNT